MKQIARILGIVGVALMSGVACVSQAENQAERAATSSSTAAPSTEKPPLKWVQSITLPGVEGRFDHFAVDLKHQRLFVAALGNNSLEILDLKTGKSLRSVQNLPEPTGVAFVPELNCVFVACGGGERCEILDGDTFSVIQSVAGLPDADNVRYDRKARQIFVGYGDGAIAVINAQNGQKIGDIPLEAHPESFQLEENGPRIFVNVPEAGYIAVIDRQKRAVIAKWSTRAVKANFPMALDEAGHRLFVGCRAPAQVLIFNTASGQLEDTQRISGDTDDLFWDAKRARLYVSCGAGRVDVLQVEGKHWSSRGDLITSDGVRTSLFVPSLNRLFVAVPHRGAQNAEIRVFAVLP